MPVTYPILATPGTGPPGPAPTPAPPPDEPTGQWVASYLAEATTRFHRSLDLGEVVGQVLRSLVPRLVEAAVLHLWDDDRSLRPVGAAHADEALAGDLLDHLARLALPRDAVEVLLPRGGAASRGLAALEAALLGQQRCLDDPWPPTASQVAILTRDDRPVGVLHVRTRPGGCPLLAKLLPELAARAGRALSNAATTAEHAALTAELHRAVAPAVPPVLGGLHVASRYLAASRSRAAGGDFFDIREGPAGITAVLGDVQGHGIPAVATAALCRLTVRGLGASLHRPADLLEALDRTLGEHFATGEGAEGFATAVAVVLRPGAGGSWDAEIATGGHPPPLVVRGGVVEAVDVQGLLLGALGPRPRGHAQVALAPGDALVLASDGIVGAGGARGIADVLSDVDRGDATAVAESLMAWGAVAGDPGDDRSVVVLVAPDHQMCERDPSRRNETWNENR